MTYFQKKNYYYYFNTTIKLMKQMIVTDRGEKYGIVLKVILLHIMVLQYKYTRS